MTDSLGSKGPFGEALPRREDPSILTGRGTYVDDLQRPNMVYASIVRSEYGHARIESIDTSRAEAEESVVAVYTAEDLDAAGVPGNIPRIYRVPNLIEVPHPVLAREKVTYQGKPVAVVVAEGRYQAHNAAELVDVDYERLDTVTDPVDAMEEDAPTIREEAPDNVAFSWETGDEAAVKDQFAAAAETYELELTNQRIIPNAIEPRCALAEYDSVTDQLTIDIPSQQPFVHQSIMAGVLDHPQRKIRIRTPNIGGGFGSKSMFYPDETITAFCAKQLERPVKWVETRGEAFQADEHGRGHRIRATVGVDDDGRLTGLRVRTYCGIGGEVGSKGCLAPSTTFGLLLSGQYDIPAIHFKGHGVLTNETPTGVYRGVGRAEAIFTIERVMETVARARGEDPTEYRRRHFVQPDQFPYETAVGSTYDSGEYENALDRALETADYEGLRARQAELREEGRYLGIGIACFLESGGLAPSKMSELLGMGLPDASVKSSFWESSTIRVHETGEVTTYVGTSSPGTGVETTHSQIVADKLGVDIDDISLHEGKDTDQAPTGTGSIGSRSGPVGGGAIARSIQKVIEKGGRIAAHKLEVAPADVEFEDGEFFPTGAPDRAIGLREVAQEAHLATDLPEGEEPGLEATSYYDPENFTWAFGTHLVVVEVDADTGELEVLDYVAVDDCGVQINPQIVEGQIHGGVAQGLGQALYEGAEYDDTGNLLTASMSDYTVPKSTHVPEMRMETTVTPSPHNPLGVKGVAESGTIAATPAVVNAVTDALQPFGVDDIEMPMTEERIWRAMQNGSGGEE